MEDDVYEDEGKISKQPASRSRENVDEEGVSFRITSVDDAQSAIQHDVSIDY